MVPRVVLVGLGAGKVARSVLLHVARGVTSSSSSSYDCMVMVGGIDIA